MSKEFDDDMRRGINKILDRGELPTDEQTVDAINGICKILQPIKDLHDQKEGKTIMNEKHLCDTCQKHPAECDSVEILWGIDRYPETKNAEADTVVECDAYKRIIRPDIVVCNSCQFKGGDTRCDKCNIGDLFEV